LCREYQERIEELERDLDIAIYKFWESVHVGVFKPSHYENLKKKLEDEFYKNFDFDRLFIPNEQGSNFEKLLPWATGILQIITVILVFRK